MPGKRWGLTAAVVAAALLGGGAPSAQAASYEPAELLFAFQDPRVNESSGMVAARRTPGVLFTHNDSADAPRFFAIGPSGETLATFDVAGAINFDWEDMAAYTTADGEHRLVFADIGDNNRVRRTVRVFEVAEPAVDVSQTGVTASVPVVRARELRYVDGQHDAEAVVVDPADGTLYVIAKEPYGLSKVFEARPGLGVSAPGYVAEELLVEVATINLLEQAVADDDPVAGLLDGGQATGGDWSADRSRFVVRTYRDAFEWNVAEGQSLGEAIEASAPERVELARVRSGETIAYAVDASALLTSTEGVGGLVHRLPRSTDQG